MKLDNNFKLQSENKDTMNDPYSSEMMNLKKADISERSPNGVNRPNSLELLNR